LRQDKPITNLAAKGVRGVGAAGFCVIKNSKRKVHQWKGEQGEEFQWGLPSVQPHNFDPHHYRIKGNSGKISRQNSLPTPAGASLFAAAIG
jgi:hypothetical protein